MPWLIFGYNFAQRYHQDVAVLHAARHPGIPPAHVHNFVLPLDLNNPMEADKSVLHRAGVANKAGIMAGNKSKDCTAS